MSLNNFTHKTNFRLDIPDGNATENFVINIQNCTLPTFTIEQASVMINPLVRGNIPGTAATFEPLNLRFIVDEEFKSYLDIYQWMISIVDYREGKSTAHDPGGQPRNIILHILDNSKKKIVCTYRFYGAWPQSLGEVEFDYTEEGNMAIISNVMFYYKYFEIEKGGIIIKPRKPRADSSLPIHPSMR